MTLYRRFLWLLIGLVVSTQAFIPLELVYGRINIPLVDVAVMAVCVVFGLELLRRLPIRRWFGRMELGPAGSGHPPPPPLPLPAPLPAALFLGVAFISLANTFFYFDCWYFLLRKPIFSYVAYGAGLTGALLAVGDFRRLYSWVLFYAFLVAAICITASIPLWLTGYAAAFVPVPHLSVNHKTFAVALAPYLPFLWMGRLELTGTRRRLADVTMMLAVAAVGISVSKTAWITALFGLGGLLRLPGRKERILERPGWIGLGILVVMGVMVALPFLLHNPLMADAFDSRMSLNLRAWEMFRQRPFFGAGPGTSTLWQMQPAPHSRITGVDAHGVIQKIGGEFGLGGLLTYGAFTLVIMRGLWRTAFAPGARPDPLTLGAVIMGLGLHVNLLLSTEYFTASHWVPLSISLAMALAAASSKQSSDTPLEEAFDRQPHPTPGTSVSRPSTPSEVRA